LTTLSKIILNIIILLSQNIASLEEKHQAEIAEYKVWLGEESIEVIWPILGKADRTK
jgi:hypothetical protein